VGDVVQRVDDIKCHGEVLYSVEKRLCDPEDSSVEFEIDREGQVLHLQLELKDRQDWE
jgi:S1-C subfamily serine protease